MSFHHNHDEWLFRTKKETCVYCQQADNPCAGTSIDDGRINLPLKQVVNLNNLYATCKNN